MNPANKLLVLVFGLLLSSCNSRARSSVALLDSWFGKPESDVLSINLEDGKSITVSRCQLKENANGTLLMEERTPHEEDVFWLYPGGAKVTSRQAARDFVAEQSKH